MQGVDNALLQAEVIDPATVVPILPTGEDERTGLSERTRKRLLDLGIRELFAVQTAFIPFIVHQNFGTSPLCETLSYPRDVCVSAPTGSGKTLAYVLPVIEVLSSRIVTRLRALVVLPTRDLVTQVKETFEAVGKGRGLKIGTATGQHSFSHEQAQLVEDVSTSMKGGSSKVDILICTPGRLMDHLNGTLNFTLQHLRFLVIDEADRLLAQSFQDWLVQVLAACGPRRRSSDKLPTTSPLHDSNLLPICDSLSPALLQTYVDYHTDVDEFKETSCQKLLFSATLTQDPGRLASLDLRNPKYFIVQSRAEGEDRSDPLDVISERFTMPATLTEHMVICDPSVKPLILLHLIYNLSIRSALVFTKSSESTSRLVRLVGFFEDASTDREHVVICAYSSDLPTGERKRILEKFKAQEIHILVCSDLISRGADISHVSHVISYDAPVDMRKYVHRVGRTARAGRTGDAWTLVEEQEARYFKGMLREHSHLERVKRIKIPQKETEGHSAAYQIALQKLKEAYAR
ncbi:P-loop containing nucleoside triphosphate hydrolase protein [Pisolithus orientalis]|uniref:P-loop containing nucleoside triphosphate hydrolase protein n=1 Tax=Pisolithus orientalis TaxID=936130 RepID=UPI0022250BD7|nr:P-loop containing nucleoside triphosphate hydrolase protein [Pisolithus orientalis]KAI6025600.1 P-loop containing nucleoside triphosphate hydrolase protein [Pisolithus orientalis]